MTFEWDEKNNLENIKNNIYTNAPDNISKTILEGEIVTDFLPLFNLFFLFIL